MKPTPPAPDLDIALDVAREAALDALEARNIALEALDAYEARNVALDAAIGARNAALDNVLEAAIALDVLLDAARKARNAAADALLAIAAHEAALVALVAVYATHARRRQGTV